MHGTPVQAISELDGSTLTFRPAASKDEREQAFRLVYQAYQQSGLVEANPMRMRILPHHLLSTTEVFVALHGNRVLSTVTLIRDGELGLPMEEIYPDEIAAQRVLGKRLGEVSCLASVANLNLKVCLELFRVMVQAARQRGVDALSVAIHPKHERFYRRYLAFESLGGRVGYPSLCNNPAVALLLDFQRLDAERPPCRQRFFGQPLPSQTLRAVPMSLEDKRRLARQLLQTASTSVVTVAATAEPENRTDQQQTEPPTGLPVAQGDSLQLEPICIG